MFLTEITPYKGFTRKIDLVRQSLDTTAKTIINECILHHYLGELLIAEMNKLIVLTNDNKATITVQGAEVGDYDLVATWAEDGISSKEIFADLMNYCDANGKINEKANYQF